MGTKIGLVLGLGIGFMLGAKAGHDRYRQIKGIAGKVRDVPIIAKPLDAVGEKVADVVRAKGEEIADAVAESVKEKLFGVRKDELVAEEIILIEERE